METDSGFRFPIAGPVYQSTGITIINLTPIISDIILIVPIWDGEVTGGINIATISIGITIDQVILTKAPTMDINEAINGVAPVYAMETVIGRVTIYANGDDNLIVCTGKLRAG